MGWLWSYPAQLKGCSPRGQIPPWVTRGPTCRWWLSFWWLSRSPQPLRRPETASEGSAGSAVQALRSLGKYCCIAAPSSAAAWGSQTPRRSHGSHCSTVGTGRAGPCPLGQCHRGLPAGAMGNLGRGGLCSSAQGQAGRLGWPRRAFGSPEAVGFSCLNPAPGTPWDPMVRLPAWSRQNDSPSAHALCRGVPCEDAVKCLGVQGISRSWAKISFLVPRLSTLSLSSPLGTCHAPTPGCWESSGASAPLRRSEAAPAVTGTCPATFWG